MVKLKLLIEEALKKNKPEINHNKSNRFKTTKNKTGFVNIKKAKASTTKKGYTWVFTITSNKKTLSFSSVNLLKLFQKCNNQGYTIIIVNKELATQTLNNEGLNWNMLKDLIIQEYEAIVS